MNRAVRPRPAVERPPRRPPSPPPHSRRRAISARRSPRDRGCRAIPGRPVAGTRRRHSGGMPGTARDTSSRCKRRSDRSHASLLVRCASCQQGARIGIHGPAKSEIDLQPVHPLIPSWQTSTRCVTEDPVRSTIAPAPRRDSTDDRSARACHPGIGQAIHDTAYRSAHPPCTCRTSTRPIAQTDPGHSEW